MQFENPSGTISISDSEESVIYSELLKIIQIVGEIKKCESKNKTFPLLQKAVMWKEREEYSTSKA